MADEPAPYRILVVEDETLVMLAMEDALSALGCEVIGPTGRLDVALELASNEAIDAALLDVTLRGGKVYAVAERLMARDIPFVLASGYMDWALPDSLQNQPRLHKPFTLEQLEDQVRFLCREADRRKGPSADRTRK